MSRIARDREVDFISTDEFSIIPRAPDASQLSPIKGAIAYDIATEPLGSIWFSNGDDWQPISGGLLGFPFTNSPFPVLPPNGGIPIFNSGTQSWTVYALSGDVSMTNGGVTTVEALQGNTVGPFTALSLNDVLVWDGAKWTNGAVAGSTPIGPAGGALTGTYPNPGLAASGVAAGSWGVNHETVITTVNAAGLITNVLPSGINSLNAGVFANVHTEIHQNVPAGNPGAIPIMNYQLPDGFNMFKLYIAWQDTNGNGGSYEYSGMVRFLGGVITDVQFPFFLNNGSTLQTVFGANPTVPPTVSMTLGAGSLNVSFQQDTWNYNTNAHLEFTNSAGTPL